MGFFSRIFRLGSAGTDQLLTRLEDGREVELTRGDLRQLKQDEARVLEGLAEIKASIVALEKDIQSAKTRRESYENNAMALLQKDPQDASSLARQNALESEREEENIRLLNEQLIHQTKLEMETRSNLRTIQDSLRTADNDLRLMQSMAAAKRSSEKARTGLAGIGHSNALERIQERKKKIAHDLEKSRALREITADSGPAKLEEATKKALEGTGGVKKLQELRARLQPPN